MAIINDTFAHRVYKYTKTHINCANYLFLFYKFSQSRECIDATVAKTDK